MKFIISPKRKRYIMLRKGIGFSYREKNGNLVLRNQTSWHKINGIWLNTNLGCFWFEFRRTK